MTDEAGRRRSIGQLALLSAGFLILVGISAASVLLVNKAREDSIAVVHTVEVEKQISVVLLDLRRAESAARGYLLTSKPQFFGDYEASVKAARTNVEQLANLTSDNPRQIANSAKLRPAVEERLVELEQAVDFVKRGDLTGGVAMLRDGTGDIVRRITEIAATMRVEEDSLFALRTKTADRSQQLASIVTISGSGLVIALAGISIFLVRRSVRARDAAEQQIRDNNINLESTVNERTADLREANEEIQRFAYIVSHDLRSPLVNIMGFTSELEELRGDIFSRIARYSRAASGDSALPEPLGDSASADQEQLSDEDKQLSQDFSEALGFIKSSIGKMDRLIAAILNLTREGRRTFLPVKIDTRELIENIVSTLAHQAAEANAQIRVEPLPDLVSDRLSMEQIFSNLIDNALKYLKPGAPGDILIRGRHKLGFAIFEIVDNGRGIDAKDHQRIFDLFRRAGLQDKQGQGIGLAHVRALIRRLGGTINVASELGTGSTFTVTLPVQWNYGNQGKES